MNVSDLAIADVKLLTPRKFNDERGFFVETWNANRFEQDVCNATFVQDNFSVSKAGTLRGLHYQIQQPQGKLVRVSLGSVFDVAVDLRRTSKTFGHWVGAVLSAENACQLWVPPGFAHGFKVIGDAAHFSYKCTDYYAPEHERTLLWNDLDLGIEWPPTPSLLVSEKDQQGVAFSDAETYQ